MLVTLNPADQYANDRNFRARQRLWQHQEPYFDLMGWVVGLAGLSPGVLRPGLRVLDAGCGNGAYLHAVRALQSGQALQSGAGCVLPSSPSPW